MKNEWWFKGPNKVVSELSEFAPGSDSFRGVKAAVEMSMSRIDARIGSLSALLKMDTAGFDEVWVALGEKRCNMLGILSRESDNFMDGFLKADWWLRDGISVFEGLRCCCLNRRLFEMENEKV